MNLIPPSPHRSIAPPRSADSSRGLTTLEVVVAASLLATSIGFLMPLCLSTGKLWREARQMRMASDVLVTEIDLLTHLDTSLVAERLEQLQPSDEVMKILPGAKFTHRLSEDSDRLRIELSLDWQRGHPAQPLTLIGWTMPHTSGDEP